MKKSLFPLTIALVALCSCGSSDNLEKTSTSDNESTRVPIELIVSNPFTPVTTRGVGSVGDLVDNPNNIWNKEELLISMFKRDDADFSYAMKDYDDIDVGAEVMKDVLIYAPSSDSQTNSDYVTMTSYKYYPAQGAYSFFVYRIDDAINIPAGGVQADAYHLNDAKTERSVDVKIDGTQDIMVATTSTPESLPSGFASYMLYSAKTARNGIHPNLVFKHMLTRLRFVVKPGNEAAADATYGVKIKAIKVNSKTTGELVYAYNKEDGDFRLDFDDTEDFLTLKERSGANTSMSRLTPVALKWDTANDVATKEYVGESLLVAPAKSYKINLTITQQLKNGTTPIESSLDLRTLILANEAESFQAGASYDVEIEIFGAEEIKVKATLTGWSDGGTLNVSTDDF